MRRAAKAWSGALAASCLVGGGLAFLAAPAAAAAPKTYLVTFTPAALAPAANAAAAAGPVAPGAAAPRRAAPLAAAAAALAARGDASVRPVGASVALVSTTLSSAQLAKRPGVASVEPERTWQPTSTTTFGTEPGDALQWSLANGGGRDLSGWPSTAGADIDAPDAWTVSTGQGVVVAVADTGIDLAHGDLAPNIRIAPTEDCNGSTDGDGNGFIADCRGWDFGTNDNDPTPAAAGEREHGTHVAGLVAASRDGVGAGGVAPDARILPLKITNATGAIVTSAAVASIVYAADNGARVYNASWGALNARSPAMEAAIVYARSKGMLVVAGAGNNGTSLARRDKFYPASYAEMHDNVVSVAATSQTDLLASFSNRDTVTLAAPGTYLWSTVPGGGWGLHSGTSEAAALVSGTAALVFAAHPDWTPAQVRQQLVATADKPLPLVGAGAGRLDAARAVGATVAARSTVAAPQRLTMRPLARAITVGWMLPSTADVASIEVSAIGPNGAIAGSTAVGPTATSATVTGLAPSTPYTVVVRAVDTHGRGVTSVNVATTTVVLPSPLNVRVNGTATDLAVQFERPTAPGWGTVARYRVAVGSDVRLVTAAGGTFSIPFGPFAPGTEVTGSVTSVAATGDESAPVPFSITTSDASAAPQATVAADFGALTVTVQPLESFADRPAVTAYVVRAGSMSRTVPAKQTPMVTTFNGLAGPTAVSVQALHTTRAGTFNGVTAAVGTFTPLPVGPPPTPTGIQITQQPGRVLVTWDAGGVTTTAFEVQLDTGTAQRVAAGGQPSATFVNPGRTGTHRITVRSVNPYGKTPASATFTVVAVAPLPVTDLVVTPGPANVTATWNSPEGSWVTRYEVRVDGGPVLSLPTGRWTFVAPAPGAHVLDVVAVNPFGRSAVVSAPFVRT